MDWLGFKSAPPLRGLEARIFLGASRSFAPIEGMEQISHSNNDKALSLAMQEGFAFTTNNGGAFEPLPPLFLNHHGLEAHYLQGALQSLLYLISDKVPGHDNEQWCSYLKRQKALAEEQLAFNPVADMIDIGHLKRLLNEANTIAQQISNGESVQAHGHQLWVDENTGAVLYKNPVGKSGILGYGLCRTRIYEFMVVVQKDRAFNEPETPVAPK